MTKIYLLMLALVLLILLAVRFIHFYSNKPRFKVGEEVRLTTTLLAEPQTTGSIQRFYIDNILVIAARFPEYHYGDKLAVIGRLEERVIDNNLRKRIVQMVYFPKIEKSPPAGALALTQVVRQKIVAVFSQSLPSTQSSLILGIVFGFRESLPAGLNQALRDSGALHVVAASGMNVTMVASFLSAMFGLLFKRQIALILSIVGIFYYALIAGFEPSITRAALMGSLSFSALVLGRQNWAILTLMMVGYLMLFISPDNIENIGFQLSFMATLGLITIKPLFGKTGFFDDLTTTFAAQVATLPIILANFGSYSLLSIAANALALWTIPPIMILGGIASFFSLILPLVSHAILIISLPFLLFFEQIVRVFANLGGGWKVEELPPVIIIGYYLISASILLFFSSKKTKNA